MTLTPWAELVTREVRERLPDVRAARRGTTVTWTHGKRTATLDAATAARWWLRTGGALTYCETPDEDHAHVAASNILVHFDARWCRGIDHEPYSADEMARMTRERPLRSTLGA